MNEPEKPLAASVPFNIQNEDEVLVSTIPPVARERSGSGGARPSPKLSLFSSFDRDKSLSSSHLETDSVILHSVPEVSYSSSDDDDFYYDAPEETPVIASPVAKEFQEPTIESMDKLKLKSNRSSSIDWDALYEDEEEELGSIENHGSVISHLISQVKIGMDLTKVVLPTFILERRSLLEMYADFFAHPDLFVR